MDFSQVVADLHMSVHKNSDLLSQMLTKRQRKSLTAFLQSPDNFMDSGLNLRHGTALVQAAPSAEIFGTLKQMKEGFETNLAASQKEEMRSQGEYEDVKKGKQEEIAAGTAQIDTKTGELADTDASNAESKKMLGETRATLAAD